jgi:hypothetical protein
MARIGRRIGRALRRVGRAVTSVVKVAAPIVGSVVGGPVGGAIGGAIGGLLSKGDKFKNVLSGAMGGLTSGGGGIGGLAKGVFGSALKGVGGGAGKLLGGISGVAGKLGGAAGVGKQLGGMFGSGGPLGTLLGTGANNGPLGALTGGQTNDGPLGKIMGMVGGVANPAKLLGDMAQKLIQPGGVAQVATSTFGGSLPGMLGPDGPVGKVLNSVGGTGLAETVKGFTSGPGQELASALTGGSGTVGQLFGNPAPEARSANLSGLTQAVQGMGSAAALAQQFGQISDLQGLLQSAEKLATDMRKRVYAGF